MRAKRVAPSDAPRNWSAAEAASPASFQPVKAQTRAGARRPSGRLLPDQRLHPGHGTSWVAVAEPPVRDRDAAPRRRGRRRLRLHPQGPARCRAPGSPYLALELRDRTGAIPAPRLPRRRPARAGASSAATSCASRAASSASATSCRSTSRAIARAPRRRGRPGRVPARRLPRPRRARRLPRAPRRRGPRRALRARCSTACSATRELRAALRRAPCTRAGHHAYLGGLLEHTVAVGDARGRGLRAAPAARPGPAAHGGARPRPRPHARVHARRRDRAHRRGAPARPRRARAAAARRARARRPASTTPAASRSPTAC